MRYMPGIMIQSPLHLLSQGLKPISPHLSVYLVLCAYLFSQSHFFFSQSITAFQMYLFFLYVLKIPSTFLVQGFLSQASCTSSAPPPPFPGPPSVSQLQLHAVFHITAPVHLLVRFSLPYSVPHSPKPLINHSFPVRFLHFPGDKWFPFAQLLERSHKRQISCSYFLCLSPLRPGTATTGKIHLFSVTVGWEHVQLLHEDESYTVNTRNCKRLKHVHYGWNLLRFYLSSSSKSLLSIKANELVSLGWIFTGMKKQFSDTKGSHAKCWSPLQSIGVLYLFKEQFASTVQ